jgi:hypothetical protein
MEEHKARMDELEGTVRARVGVIEGSLDRIEGTAKEEDCGKKIESPFMARSRGRKKDKEKK